MATAAALVRHFALWSGLVFTDFVVRSLCHVVFTADRVGRSGTEQLNVCSCKNVHTAC